MRTILNILFKILSMIWETLTIPLKLLLTIGVAVIVYVLTYAAIIGGVLWLLVG